MTAFLFENSCSYRRLKAMQLYWILWPSILMIWLLLTTVWSGDCQRIDLNGMMAEIMGKCNGTCKEKVIPCTILVDADWWKLRAMVSLAEAWGLPVGATILQQKCIMERLLPVSLLVTDNERSAFHEAVNMYFLFGKLPVIFIVIWLWYFCGY